ncbi:MAG: hypothetical protein RLZ10_1289 [Bacteroidota bacterium]|jgi:hypothetical protein
MKLAPIVLFTFKRLDTLKQTIEALEKNYMAKESELIIFSDAAKGDADKIAVEKVREYLVTIHGFKKIIIHEAKQNKGLAQSIIDGVSQVLKTHDSVIVLEDDLVTSPNFLNFMNESLIKYLNIENVFSISGFSFDLKFKEKFYSDSYFLNRGWSWGWATWKDRWEKVDWKIIDYNSFINNKTARKNFSKGGSDLNGMLDRQMTGKLDSWAIRWFYNQFKLNGLTLFPVHSKIVNEGFGKDATHTTGSSRRYIPNFDTSNKTKFIFPEKIEVSEVALKRFQLKMGYLSRVRSKIETLLGL